MLPKSQKVRSYRSLFLNRARRIHFVGIGGSGMSGIAELLKNLDFEVTGSDLVEGSAVRRLRRLGCRIEIGHKAENIGNADVVVVSSAVSAENVEVVTAREAGIPVIRRAEMLAELMRLKYAVLIAGAHGKTTTTSMAATMLYHAGWDPTVVLGGRLSSFGSGARLGEGEIIVAEADESDGSFNLLLPTIAVITNIDAEHLDFYNDMESIEQAFVDFANKVPFFGSVILCLDCIFVQRIIPRISRPVITYGLNAQADYRADNIIEQGYSSRFDIFKQGQPIGQLHLSIPGRHNICNALAAFIINEELQVERSKSLEALLEFKGVDRRFEVKAIVDGITLVDDYGHHPTEIKATLSTARRLCKGRLITVFQPHRYTRTKHLLDQFNTSFHDTDLLILLDIYPASEKPMPGVDSGLLMEGIKRHGHRNVHHVASFERAVDILLSEAAEPDMVLTLGAGPVFKVGDMFLEAKGYSPPD